MFENFIYHNNYVCWIVCLFVAYFFVIFLPIVWHVYAVFTAVWLGLKLAKWLMTVSRKYILHKTVCSNNKAVLITGCDSGFGNELARKMDKLGYKVYACCLDPNGEGAKELLNKCSERLTVLPLDVTVEQSIQEVKEFVTKDLGQKSLWAVVNNAGIGHWSEIDWTPIEVIQKVYNVNTLGTLRMTKAFLPFLKKSKGRIINVASISGRIHCAVFTGYCMSKSAVISLTTGLRIELAKWGVKAISIEPSFYTTPLVTTEASLASAENIWETAPKEIKNEYGEEFIQSFKRYISDYLKFFCDNRNTSEVTDCMVDAVTSEEPMSIYFPCSLKQRIFISLLLFLPNVVNEYIQAWLLNQYAKPLSLISKQKEK